jgi:hypothetical protein
MIIDEHCHIQALIIMGTVLVRETPSERHFSGWEDRTVRLNSIVINEGTFIAGLAHKPFNGNLYISLEMIYDWNKYGIALGKSANQPTMPEFGQRSIACFRCRIEIHG